MPFPTKPSRSRPSQPLHALLPVPARLDHHTTTNLPEGRLLLVPLGATEQHGPHLPLGTDTFLADLLVAALPEDLAGSVVIAPTIPYGSSGEHQGFPGTLSVGSEALRMLLVELGRSALPNPLMQTPSNAFIGVMFISAHGGNGRPVREAVAILTGEGRHVSFWEPRIKGADAHAGHTETSMLLHLAPNHVRPADWPSGNTAPLVELMPELMRGGVAAVSPNGILGDPSRATAEEGEEVFASLIRSLTDAVRKFVAEANS